VIDAKKEAEREAVGITVEAEAKKNAAHDSAEAILTEAKASADAKILEADAQEKVLAVEAEGKQALYEAENVLKNEQIELQRALAILKVLPDVVANAVKPLENIDGIKILQGYGAAGDASVLSNGSAGSGSSGGMAEQVTNAALSYRANAPVVDSLLRELGMVNGESGNLEELVRGNSPLLDGSQSTENPLPEKSTPKPIDNAENKAKDD